MKIKRTNPIVEQVNDKICIQLWDIISILISDKIRDLICTNITTQLSYCEQIIFVFKSQIDKEVSK